MNKKGFTLIEILGVILLLAIILVIAIPKVINILDQSKQNLYDSTISEIERVTSQYLTSNPNEVEDTLPFNVTVTTLCNANYLDCPIKNPIDNSDIDGYVEVNLDSNGYYTYTFVSS